MSYSNGTISSTTVRQQSTLGLARFYFDEAFEHRKKTRFFLSKAIRTLEDAEQQTLEVGRNYLRWATLLERDQTYIQERDECLRHCKRILDSLPVKAHPNAPILVDDSLDPLEVGRFCSDLGEAFFRVGDLDDARCCIDLAIRLFYERHFHEWNDAEISRCHCRLAHILLQQDAFDVAVTEVDNAILMASHMTTELITLFHEVVSTDFDQDGYNKKIRRFCRLIIPVMKECFLDPTVPMNLGRAHCIFSLTHYKLGNLNDAQGYAEKAAQIFDEHAPKSEESWLGCHVMGQIMLERKNFDDAVTRFQRAAEIADSIKSMASLATTFRGLGHAFYSQRDYDQALSFTLKAIQIQESHCDAVPRKLAQSYRQLGPVYRDMGLACHNQGNYDQARNLIQRAIEIQECHCASENLAQSYKLLGLVFDSQGERVQAAMCYRKAIEHFEGFEDVEFDLYQKLGLSAAFALIK